MLLDIESIAIELKSMGKSPWCVWSLAAARQTCAHCTQLEPETITTKDQNKLVLIFNALIGLQKAIITKAEVEVSGSAHAQQLLQDLNYWCPTSSWRTCLQFRGVLLKSAC